MQQMAYTQGQYFEKCECKCTHKQLNDDKFKKDYDKWVRKCKTQGEWLTGQGLDDSSIHRLTPDGKIDNQLHMYQDL